MDQTQRCRKRETLRPPPGALPRGFVGNGKRPPFPGGCGAVNTLHVSTQREHNLQDPHSEEERDPQVSA